MAERARLARAQAENMERKNAVQDGEYLHRDEARTAMIATAMRIRSKLLALPSKLAPYVAPAMTTAKAQGLLKTEVYAALDELATTVWDVESCEWVDAPKTKKG